MLGDKLMIRETFLFHGRGFAYLFIDVTESFKKYRPMTILNKIILQNQNMFQK